MILLLCGLCSNLWARLEPDSEDCEEAATQPLAIVE